MKLPDKSKTQNAHIVINNNGEIVSTYRKIHLFDMENKDTGVRLMESDYVKKGCEIVAPVSSPVGNIGLSIVSIFDFNFQMLLKLISCEIDIYYTNCCSVMTCVSQNYHFALEIWEHRF